METDVVVVGAGPVGLYAAYCAGFRGLSVLVVDALPQPGGQITAMYPEKLIHDVAGFPAVQGRVLVDGLVAQADRYSPTWWLAESADELVRLPDGRLRLSTTGGRQVTTTSVVIAGGIGSFTPRALPAGAAFVGRGIEYFVLRPNDYAGHDVLIVGGGDSAVDWALTLEQIAKSVTLVHRRNDFRAHGASIQALTASSAVVRTPFVVHDVQGSDQVEGVVVKNTATGDLLEVPCTQVVAALGFVADLGPLTRWGLRIEGRAICVDPAMNTGIPGVYAAGDITQYVGKVRLMSVGFGEAALAINNAAAASDPGSALFPGHSTESAA